MLCLWNGVWSRDDVDLTNRWLPKRWLHDLGLGLWNVPELVNHAVCDCRWLLEVW